MRKLLTLVLAVFLILPMFTVKVFAADAKEELSKSNEFIEKSLETVKADDFSKGKDFYEEYNEAWIELEGGVKEQSKQAYGDIEGVVLTKSKTVYDDAERDMVSAKAYLTVDPIQKDKAVKVIDRMHGYLSLLEGNTSYGIVDVITIILREGLEALLVVIALLGFLKKSDQEDKKTWIYGGVVIGRTLSIIHY